MPNDCLRTVNVSRAPAPCRFSTIPSKTCTRRRVPSITWKWTRTVSPALKRGTLRNWARSRSWMTLLMKRGPDGRRPRVPKSWALRYWKRQPRGLSEADSVGRPVDEEDDPDQLVAWHRAPCAGIARLRAVVAHHEVVVRRDVPYPAEVGAVRKASRLGQVWLLQH